MFSLPKSIGVLMLLAAQSALVAGADSCGPDIQTVCVVKTITTVINADVTSLNLLTIESILTVPHLCYTHTILGPYVPPTTTATPTPVIIDGTTTFYRTRCGAVAHCAIDATFTEYRPKHDPCCATTPTISTPSSTTSCQTGCMAIMKETITVTLESSEYFNPLRTTSRAHSNYLSEYPTPLPPSSSDTDPDDYKLLIRKTAIEARPSATPPPLYIPLNSDSPEEEDDYPCTTTYFRAVLFTSGPTRTIFPNTYIKSQTLDCVACKVYERVDHGPVVIYDATVTNWETSTSTTFVCAPTEEA